MRHDLKIHPDPFHNIHEGRKTFEIRMNDRGFNVGDALHLELYNPDDLTYDGSYIDAHVTHIVHGPQWGILEGFCVMSINVFYKHIQP